ncbi:MAG: hypothetical protein KGZ58_11215 [Ignavibacteriales bacterium]|nr:hypothetical protein [Ignavibacteriales bacterium]
MDNESSQVQQKKKQQAPAYSQRQAEERLAHFLETIPEMKHPREMETVLSITKDIIESGFDVTAVHQMLAERAMFFVLKELEEAQFHHNLEAFILIAKQTVANIRQQLYQAGEMSMNLTRNKLEEGDVGMVRRFLHVCKTATDELRSQEEQLEARLMELADEKLNDDTIELVENYIGIAKSIIPDLTPQRQQLTEKVLRLAERALDQGKLELTERYVGLAAIAGGDVATSQEYLAKKVAVLAEKENQVPIKQRNVDLVWQLLRIINSVSGDSAEIERKLVADIDALEKKKLQMQIFKGILVLGILVGLVYGYFWWRDEQKLAQIEAEKQAEQQRETLWQQKISNAKSGDILYEFTGHSEGITDIAISPDNKYLVSVANDHSTRVRRLNDGKEIRLPDKDAAIFSVTISQEKEADKFSVFVSSSTTIYASRLLSGERENMIDAHGDWINALTVTFDNQYLVSASNDMKVKMWNRNDGSIVKEFSGHTAPVYSIALDSKNTIYSASDDSTIRIWTAASDVEQSIVRGFGAGIKSISLFADGNTLALCGTNGIVKVYNISEGKFTTVDVGNLAVSALSFTSDGLQLLMGTTDGNLITWDRGSAKILSTTKLHQGNISSLCISSSSSFIITSGGEDNLVRVLKYR